jgi:hypothetical protein
MSIAILKLLRRLPRKFPSTLSELKYYNAARALHLGYKLSKKEQYDLKFRIRERLGIFEYKPKHYVRFPVKRVVRYKLRTVITTQCDGLIIQKWWK